MPLFPYAAGAVSDSCAELDRWRDRLDRQRAFPRRWAGRMRRDLEAEAVAASLSIEQVPVTVDEVRRILVGESPPSVSPGDQELVLGYRDAMSYVLRRADDAGFRWSRELVIGLHDRVLAGNYAAEAGRFARGARWVTNRVTGEVVYTPADSEAVPGLIDRACEHLAGSEDHPAVQAAWFHVVTAAIHPFRDGNGRVARVLASLAMYRGGFRRNEFTSLEEWWGRHVADYYAAFECLGSRFDEEADVTPFIAAHVSAQLSQVRGLDLRERVERTIWGALEEVVESSGLQQRLVNAAWDAFFDRAVTPAYYIPLADVSRATATNDLAAAVAASLLESRGGGRGRHYIAGSALYQCVADALGLGLVDPRREEIVALLTRELAETGGVHG